MSFSAGEEWTENPETYESSFYKRTLDNEIYIFTAPSFNSKSSDRSQCVCACMCALVVVRDALQCGLAPGLSCSLLLDVIPTPLAKITLSGLWYHSRYPSPFFPLRLSAIIPSLPPSLPPARPVHFLLSALISLADTRTGKRQCNGAVRAHSYTWLD